MAGVMIDIIYVVDAVPRAGGEAHVRSCSIRPGGGFNAMAAAKRAGMQVSYGGSLGTGPFATAGQTALHAEYINILRPLDSHRDQGCCTVLVDFFGERTFIAADGAEGQVEQSALATIDYSQFDWTLLSGYTLYYRGSRDSFRDLLINEDRIQRLVFDPSPIIALVYPEYKKHAIRRALWISANEEEAFNLTNLLDPRKSAIELASGRPPGGGAVVRVGAKGCFVAYDGNCELIPAYPVKVVDSNGAGDVHLGTFIAKLAESDDPFTAARYANVAAALSTTKRGPAMPPETSEVLHAMADWQA